MKKFKAKWPCRKIAIVILLSGFTYQGYADKVDDYIKSEMKLQHIQGIALAVVENGKPVKVQGYGVASAESGALVTDETVFAIGSISKQILATAAMILVEDGELGLDDRVGDYLDEAPEHWRSITVEQLLTHTSGLQRTVPDFDWLDPRSNLEYIQSTYDSPLLFEPGENFSYSNLGYYVLAEIIAKASGSAWPLFVSDRIFNPLDMKATGATEFFDIIPNRATGHSYLNNKLGNTVPLMSVAAGGAFLSTIADMVKWDAALTSGSLVSPNTQQRMWSPTILPDGTATKYGFGWSVDEIAGHRVFRHGGGVPGFRADYNRFADDDLSVIVLANTSTALSKAIAIEVANHFIPGLSPPRTTIKLDAETLAKYAGQYQFSTDNILTIAVDGRGLSIQSSGDEAQYTMLPESQSTFFVTKDASYVFGIEGGTVTHVILTWGDNQELRAEKVP